MVRALISLSVSMLFIPVCAAADRQMESILLAQQLGDVLASEGFCGLSYDQVATQGFIEKKVRADDLQFNSTLTLMTMGAKVQHDDLSPSGKTAHCMQTMRVAKSYGFIR